MDTRAKIKEIYDNNLYPSFSKLQKLVKEKYKEIKTDDIKKFIDEQEAQQITRQKRKPKNYDSITSFGVKNNYQMDIIVYDRFMFNNYKYILCVIDVYSRYAQCRAMTNRRLDTIIENMNDIFNKMGYPKNLNLDNEFNKKEFKNYTDKHKIKLWFSQPYEQNKNAIVERFNRTIIDKLQKIT